MSPTPEAAVETEPAPKPWVTMSCEGLEGTAAATRAGFDRVWAAKGWKIVAEHDSAPSTDDDVKPEMLVDADGNVTDTPVDPQRLSKVLTGEANPEDVGVDPAVLADVDVPDAEVSTVDGEADQAAAVPAPTQPVYVAAEGTTPNRHWTAAPFVGADGEALFYFDGDAPGSTDPTGVGGPWTAYTGAVSPAQGA